VLETDKDIERLRKELTEMSHDTRQDKNNTILEMAARQRLLASAVGSQTSQYNNTATTANQSQSSSNQVHQSSSSTTNLQASNQLIQPPYNNTGPVHKPKKPPIKHSQPSIIKNSTSDPTNSRGQFSSTPILHQQVYGGSTTNLVHSGYQGGSVSNLQHSGYHGGSTGRITRWAAADNTYTQSAPAHRVAHGVNNPGLRVNLQPSSNNDANLMHVISKVSVHMTSHPVPSAPKASRRAQVKMVPSSRPPQTKPRYKV